MIYSKSREERKQDLETAFQTFRQEKLYAKPSKCEFCLEIVAFLGHVISKDGISVDPFKIEAVLKWERPKNVTEVWSFFLGLARYYPRTQLIALP